MKNLIFIFLLSLSFINSKEYTDGHYIILDDNDSTIDGEKLTSTAQNGASMSKASDLLKLTISSGGTYILSGRLTGQIEISIGKDEKIIIILDGLKLTCSSNTALLFNTGYEFYSETTIDFDTAKNLDFSKAGAKIIIADDSSNAIKGSYLDQNEGAISSHISLVISGEEKGNGILEIESEYEGIEVGKHLLIEGGIINISSKNDGININQEKISVCMIKGGELTVNGGLGDEGDGIDSNGFFIIDGGKIISASKPRADSGLDSNLGLYINGGIAIGVGTSMDGADVESGQVAMNLKFANSVGPENTLKIVDKEKNEVISFCPSKSGFKGDIRGFGGATISTPKLVLGEVYYLYLDDVQLCNEGSSAGNGGGRRPGGGGAPGGGGHGGSSDTSPKNVTTEFKLAYQATKFTGIKPASS